MRCWGIVLRFTMPSMQLLSCTQTVAYMTRLYDICLRYNYEQAN
jgi:hypothetical protein